MVSQLVGLSEAAHPVTFTDDAKQRSILVTHRRRADSVHLSLP
jgi:hypothetical protein